MHYSFNIESFRQPDAIHSPGYFWKINAPFDLAQLKAQLKDMYDHGARSVCLHPLPHDFRPLLIFLRRQNEPKAHLKYYYFSSLKPNLIPLI